MTVQVAEDGSFSTPYELTAGQWSITVTASSPQGKTSAQTRNVTVVYKGVNLVVTARNGRAWIKVWVDGKIDPATGAAGKVLAQGKSLTFTGRDRIEVRTGSSGVTAARRARAMPALPMRNPRSSTQVSSPRRFGWRA